MSHALPVSNLVLTIAYLTHGPRRLHHPILLQVDCWLSCLFIMCFTYVIIFSDSQHDRNRFCLVLVEKHSPAEIHGLVVQYCCLLCLFFLKGNGKDLVSTNCFFPFSLFTCGSGFGSLLRLSLQSRIVQQA